MQIKLGKIVSLPRKYTYGRRKFRISKIFKDGGIQLEFLGGKDKGAPLEYFRPEELVIYRKR